MLMYSAPEQVPTLCLFIMNLSKLIEIFGDGLSKHFGNKIDGAIVIFQKDADDGIRLTLKNGKLVHFEYWSPC